MIVLSCILYVAGQRGKRPCSPSLELHAGAEAPTAAEALTVTATALAVAGAVELRGAGILSRCRRVVGVRSARRSSAIRTLIAMPMKLRTPKKEGQQMEK